MRFSQEKSQAVLLLRNLVHISDPMRVDALLSNNTYELEHGYVARR